MSKLNIKKRNIQGSSSSRRMRSEGILPGIMYGSDNEPNLVEMNLHQVEQILKNHPQINCLISNAGYGDFGSLENFSIYFAPNAHQ